MVGQEQSSEYYDRHMDRQDLADHPRRLLYEQALSLLPQTNRPIAELGCGTGLFAQLLREQGFSNPYWGVDFAPSAIRLASSRVHQAEFTVGDLFSPEIVDIINKYRIFVALEVLEHIEMDMELIAQIPKGSILIASVPTFDDAGHVRHFTDSKSIVDRYKGVLNLDNQIKRLVGTDGGTLMFLFRAKKI